MWTEYLNEAIYIAKKAKDIILEVYQQDFAIENKSDNSPVTIADKRVDKLTRDYLKSKFPKHSFLTEESEDDLSRLDNDFVWIIDPLDGTIDFAARDDQFAINIALCYKHEIVMGLVLIPVTGEYYYATKGGGSYYVSNDSFPQRIHVSDKLTDLTYLTSMFYFTSKELDLVNRHKDKISKIEKYGSSIKHCRIAHGLAELTCRMTDKTKEWDTAAPQIIVEEAGGIFLEPDGNRLSYNRKDYVNRKGFIVANRIENLIK